ncbi:MAG: hypothetical protein ACI4QY_01600 [Oscillospiraceae bacterium]
MKTCEEMVKSLFERREQYLAERKSKREIAISSAVCALAAAGFLGIIVWQSGKTNTPSIPTELPSDSPALSVSSDNAFTSSSSAANHDSEANNTDKASDNEQRDYNIVWIDSDSYDEGFMVWNGKHVQMSIPDALHSLPENSKLAIRVDIGRYDDTFVYNGKTLEEYSDQSQAASLLTEKLSQLLKEGNALKYGEALYQTGTPHGEKWAREFYESRVEFYGEELLAKYIVDGEFREINATKDLEKALENAQAAQIENINAVHAYLEHQLRQMQNFLCISDQGIDMDNKTIFVTESEFASLTFEGIENCVFYPAVQNPDEPQDFVVPE